jgi:hypothetical protein
MDIMVLLMLGVDGRRNFLRYFQDESSTRIGDLISCPDWRNEYRTQKERNPVRFILNKFDEAMTGIGYQSAINDVHTIKIHGMGVLQYVLAFYSKSALGAKFWREARAGITPQLGLDLA